MTLSIPYLDKDISKNVEYLTDQHLTTVILDVFLFMQYMLAIYGPADKMLYKQTGNANIQQVLQRWARQTPDNWFYLHNFFLAGLKEYEFRFGKPHILAGGEKYLQLPKCLFPKGFKASPPPLDSSFPVVLDDNNKPINTSNNDGTKTPSVLNSWRKYYLDYVLHGNYNYTKRNEPDFTPQRDPANARARLRDF